MTKRELIKFLKTETEFLMENQDYAGSYQLLHSGYAVVVRWSPGWGKELRDDVIQASDNPDHALEATIAIYNPSDTPDAWDMPYDKKTGEIIGAGGVGISPHENYEKLAEFLLKEYNTILEHDAQSENSLEEGGKGSGNFKTDAQRYNDKKDKIFSRYHAEQERYAKFLLDNGVSAEEVEKLKQDSGLHGNPLAQKYFELKKSLKEEIVEPELPTEVVIDGELLVDDIDDIGEAYLDEVISDWLSDNYGFVHFGFDYDVVGTDVHVFNILWDTSDEYSLEESVKLNEGTANFGTNDIINLCSPAYRYEDFEDYIEELKEEEPEITEEEIEERVYDVISIYTDEDYRNAESILKEVEDYIELEPGYYEGFYLKFKFDDGAELAENWIYYTDKEDATELLKETVEKMRKALKDCVISHVLVSFKVAFRLSNGETGYTIDTEKDKTLKEIDVAMDKLLEEGLKAIEDNMSDEEEYDFE